MRKGQKSASKLHKNVPPDWYWRSIKENVFQKYWHGCRFEEVGKLVESSGGTILDIGSADGVFALEVLEHVFEPMEVFREVKRVLKKEGYGVFLVPSDNFLFKNIVWPVWTKFRG